MLGLKVIWRAIRGIGQNFLIFALLGVFYVPASFAYARLVSSSVIHMLPNFGMNYLSLIAIAIIVLIPIIFFTAIVAIAWHRTLLQPLRKTKWAVLQDQPFWGFYWRLLLVTSVTVGGSLAISIQYNITISPTLMSADRPSWLFLLATFLMFDLREILMQIFAVLFGLFLPAYAIGRPWPFRKAFIAGLKNIHHIVIAALVVHFGARILANAVFEVMDAQTHELARIVFPVFTGMLIAFSVFLTIGILTEFYRALGPQAPDQGGTD